MLLNNVNEVNSLIAQLTQYRDQLAAGAQPEAQSDTEFTSLFDDLVTDTDTSSPISVTSLEAEAAPVNYLLNDEANIGVGKPNIGEFMKATGASGWDASEAISGTVDRETDLRDWTKIMASEDPLAAARTATKQFYEAHGNDIRTKDPNPIPTKDLIATSGNLSLVKDGEKTRVVMTDVDGNRIRDFGNTENQMTKNAQAFGLDKSAVPMLLDRFLGL